MNYPLPPFAPLLPAAERAPRAILFIDAAVADAAVLAAGAEQGVLVVQLDAGRDGVEQIAEVLSQYRNLDSVQIVSHGAAGQVALGTAALSLDSMARYQDALQAWGAALSDDGDLLLYGCGVAQGQAGLDFVDGLADATGADVAASTNLTGAAALGGDWLLERSSGAIEAASAIGIAAQAAYGETLALVNGGNSGTLGFYTTSTNTLLNASGLASGAVVHADNILGLGLDIYAQSSAGGGVTIANVPGTSLLGVPLTDPRLTVNGSLLSPVSYVDVRANSGVFDAVSVKLGSGSLVGNLLGTVIFTVYALDANYQPTGVGVSLTSLVINEYGLLNFAAMADFKGIYGIRIVNPLGFEVGIDDLVVANGRVANTVTSAAYNAGTGVLSITATGIRAGDTIDASKFTITGANGATYTLTSASVTASSTTAASITLNAADKLAVNGLLNNNGASSVDGTSFNLAAAANWDGNLSNGVDLSGNPITVSNVQLPGISSATFNAASNVLTVTGSNLVKVVGANNDITVSKLAIKGEGGVTYVLSSSSSVEITSATSFSVTLSGADVAAVAALFTRNGGVSGGGTSYQLVAADDWNSSIGNANIGATVGITASGVVNSAPTISGTGAVSGSDNAGSQPFAAVTVADVNGDTVSMAISYNGANGTLSGTGLSGSAGSYTLSAASPAALTATLRALTFTPTNNQVSPGASVATTFTLTPTDGNGLAGSANTGLVLTIASVNDPTVIGGAVSGQSVLNTGTTQPFSVMTLSDPDAGATVSVTVTLDSAAKGVFTAASLSVSGFSTANGGLSYTHAATSVAAAQAALQALVFQPTSPTGTTTNFIVAVNDGHATSNNGSTSVTVYGVSATLVQSVQLSSDTGLSNTDMITSVAQQTITGGLSAALASGETVQVSLDNGASWTNASGSVGSTLWSLSGQTLSGSGTLQVRVSNAGGNGAVYSHSYTIDSTAPNAAATAAGFSADHGPSGGDLVTNTGNQTISGTLSAAPGAGEVVQVSLDNGVTWIAATVSGSSWTLANQTLSGSNILQVRVSDIAGNVGGGYSAAYTIDTQAPTATLSSNLAALKNGESATITVTFSEAPQGLTLSDFSATNGTLANLVQSQSDARVYTLSYTPSGGLLGALGTVSLAAGSYTDLAGNNGGGANSPVLNLNTQGPSVAISSSASALKSGETATITFTFSGPPTGFTLADIIATGGSVATLLQDSVNPAVYTAVFTPTANVDGVSASVAVLGGSYTDGFLNLGGGAVSPTIAVDTRAPTLAISSSLASLNIGASATVTFTFSEAPVGFTAADVTVTGGSLSALAVSADPRVYTATLTPAANVAAGSVGITVAAGSYADAAGNSGLAGIPPSVSVDTVAPATATTSVTFSADTGVSNTDLITSSALQNISGVLGTALQAGETVAVSLDNGASWQASSSVDATHWLLAGQLLTGAGTLQVRVNDAAGNHGPVYSAAYALDTSAPGVAIASSAGALRDGESATLTITFSEAPSGFTAADLSASGGTLSGFTASADPRVYTVVYTPNSGLSGVAGQVSLAAGSYTDAAGNAGTGALSPFINLNTALPGVVITSDHAALHSGQSALLTFTFTQAPTGFTAGDISVSNGTLSGFAVTADPLVYTAVLAPNAGQQGVSAVASVTAGSYTDAHGNPGVGASSAAIVLDTLAPTLSISSDVASVRAGQVANISFTFSEAPVGFTSADITVSGGTMGPLTVSPSGLVYSAVFTPTPGIENVSAVISVAGGYTDLAGNNGGAAGSPALSIDTLPPSATITGISFTPDTGIAGDLVTADPAPLIGGGLSAALGAGQIVEVTLNNGASWHTALVNGQSWTLAGQTLNSGGSLQARVSDAAGNHGTLYSTSYVLDTTPPTAAITSSATSLADGQSATITFSFSEVPSGFGMGSLTVSGGTLGNLSVTADPHVYTALFTPSAGLNGVNSSIVLNAGAYTDAAGNPGAPASAPVISIDTQAPTLTLAGLAFSADGGANGSDRVFNSAQQDIEVTLSAGVAAGDVVQLSLDNGLSWHTAGATGATWTLAGQVLSGSGAVLVRVTDAAGNHGAAGSLSYTLDLAAPTLAITSNKTALNSADSATLTFTFSEALPAGTFSAANIDVAGGTLSGFTAVSASVYTALFTPAAGVAAGVASIGVQAGAYSDIAGNGGVAAQLLPPLTYATVDPGVAISADRAVVKDGDSATITFSFSQAPAAFGLGAISVSGGTLGNLSATADPKVYTAQFTPASGIAGATASISIAAGAYTDGASNPGTAASLSGLAVDTLAPTLSISSDSAALSGGGSALLTFTFSEAPNAFTLGDIAVGNGSVSNLVQTALNVYTAVLTPAASVAGNITVGVTSYTDLAGNPGGAPSAPAIVVDTLAPVISAASAVAFSADSGSLVPDLVTNVAQQTISGVFSAAPDPGDVVEVSLDGGASWQQASLSSGGLGWSLAGATLQSGSNTLLVRVSDAAGNHGAPAGVAYTLDQGAPTVSVSSSALALKAGDSATLTYTFSEAPVGFTLASLTVSGGTLGGFSATADPKVYTVVFTPTAGSNSAAGVELVAGSYTDLAGNAGAGVSSPPLQIDTVAPTVAISSSAATLKAGDTAVITFTFSEVPSGFTLGAVSATNGVLGNLSPTADPLVYTAQFTPAAATTGSAVISIAAGQFADTAGNLAGAASAPAMAVDTVQPAAVNSGLTLQVDGGASNSDLVTNTAAQTVTGQLDQPLGAGELVQISLDGGVTWLAAIGAAPSTQWTAAVLLQEGNNIILTRVIDLAGNLGQVTSSAYTLDTQAPTLAITSSSPALLAGAVATLTLTFSDPQPGFSAAALSAINGTLGNFSATADPRVYTVELTPASGLDGAVAQLVVAPGSYSDVAGNSGAGARAQVTVDTQAPTLAISSSASVLNAQGVATITFAFSEAPLNFNLVAVTVSGGQLSGLGMTADPRVYTALFTPDLGLSGGSATVTVAAGAYTDLAGNLGGMATGPTIGLFTRAPTVGSDVILSSDTGTPGDFLTSQASQVISGTLDAALGGGEYVEVSLDNGASWSTAATLTPLSWSLGPRTLSGSGILQVRVSDVAGNHGPANSHAYTIDQDAPVLQGIASSVAVVGAGQQATLTLSFDEVPLGLSLATLNASGGTLSNLSASVADPRVYTVTFTPTPGFNGVSGIELLSGSYTDAAGNPGGGMTQAGPRVDTIVPTLAISSSAASMAAGQSVTLTFTFSEAPVGFDAGDISVSNGTLSGFTATANPLVYTALYTAQAGAASPVQIALAGGSYADQAGNAGTGAVLALPVTATALTLAISSSASSLKAGDSATITFTFSQAPSGFDAGDVSVSGGTLSNFSPSANPLVYTATFTPAPNVQAGSASISVAAGAYGGAGGVQGAAASTPPIAIDTQPPAATAGAISFSSDTGSSSSDLITATQQQTISGSLSAPLAAGESVLVSVDGGATWQAASVASGAATWSLATTLLSGTRALHVRVADAAGNYTSTSTSYTLATAPVTVQASTTTTVLSSTAPAQLTFTFSVAPVGFSAASLSVTGGAISNFSATADPKVYTALFTPQAGVANGSASVTLAGGYTDLAGNSGAGTVLDDLVVDTVAPLAVSGPAIFSSGASAADGSLLTNQATQNLSGTLSTTLAGGDVVEVSVDNGATWSTASVVGNAWSLAGATLRASGTLVVRVRDQAGNSSTASSRAYTVDTTPPSVTLSSSLAALQPGQSSTITFRLSEAGVLGLEDIVVQGGRLSNLRGSGTLYTATFTMDSTATSASIRVVGQAYTDAAGNASTESATLAVAADTSSGTPSTVDGVTIRTIAGTDSATGLASTTIVVPTITSSRTEDSSTPNASLADIPVGLAGAGLVVSLPLGAALQSSGPAVLLNQAQADIDLIGRIDLHTVADSAERALMEGQAREFLSGLGSDALLLHRTLVLSGGAGGAIHVTGDALASGGLPEGALGALSPSAEALVIEASGLAAGAIIQLDNVEFAAVMGDATVRGGSGKNFIIGDDGAQNIVLGTGSDHDTLYGNGGNDVLGTAAGNDKLDGGSGNDILFAGAGDDSLAGGSGDDVLQGGRSDSGLWQFYLDAQGHVTARHAMALGGGASEALAASELNTAEPILAFVQGQAAQLQTLSLLYHAAFGRTADLMGLDFWLSLNLDSSALATRFLDTAEARASIDLLGNADFIQALYHNSVGRDATAAELAPLLARLDAAGGSQAARGQVFAEIALRSEHVTAWTGEHGLPLGSTTIVQEQGWIANSGDDRLEGGAGSDWLVGGDGTDTVVYGGAAGSYRLALDSAGNTVLAEPDGSYDVLRQIELGEFAGQTVDLAFTQGHALSLQEIGMLYHLALGRSGDIAGFRYWVDSGLKGQELANSFIVSIEFEQRYGSLSDHDFVLRLYQNAGQEASGADLARWQSYLGQHSRGELLEAMVFDVALVGSQFSGGKLELVGGL